MFFSATVGLGFHTINIPITARLHLTTPARVLHLSCSLCVILSLQRSFHILKQPKSATAQVESHICNSWLSGCPHFRPHFWEPRRSTLDRFSHVIIKEVLNLIVIETFSLSEDVVIVCTDIGDSLSSTRLPQVESNSDGWNAKGIIVHTPEVTFIELLTCVGVTLSTQWMYSFTERQKCGSKQNQGSKRFHLGLGDHKHTVNSTIRATWLYTGGCS